MKRDYEIYENNEINGKTFRLFRYFRIFRNLSSGWPVVGASVIGLFFHFGSLLVVTFGFFLKPLSEHFNWNRTQVSLASH